jgi:hypothetical protein
LEYKRGPFAFLGLQNFQGGQLPLLRSEGTLVRGCLDKTEMTLFCHWPPTLFMEASYLFLKVRKFFIEVRKL